MDFVATPHAVDSELNGLFLLQPSFDLSRDKTSPEKHMTSPKSSPGEEPAIDQRSLPPAQPLIQEEGSAERKSPPAPAKPGTEAADPASQGSVTIWTLTEGLAVSGGPSGPAGPARP